jgi:hypothetical protein
MMPFACRYLLTLGLHFAHWHVNAAYSKTGQGQRSGKSLLRLLDSQTQEFQSKPGTRPFSFGVPAGSLKTADWKEPENPAENSMTLGPVFSSACPIPLRI